MRRLIAFFVKHSLFGDILTVAVIGIGIYAVFNIRREVFPNVSFDVVTVVTTFPGGSPSEVEELVSSPIEEALQEVEGIKKIQSVSIENRSGVNVYLDPDQTTAEKGKSDIQDIIERLDTLPEDADEPIVTSVQSKLGPIIEISISADIPAMELRNVAKRLEKEVESVKGVAKVVHKGLRDIEIRVECDIQKLARYQLTLDNVINALATANVSISAGTLETNPNDPTSRERIVRTVGKFTDLESVKKTIVRANDLGSSITVGDVAKVTFDLEKPTVINRTNGVSSLQLTVLKKEKADAIDLVEMVKQKVKKVLPALDSRIHYTYTNDLSYYIKRRLSILTSNLTIGLALVLLFLPLLIPFRFSLIIALGEPFAFLGTIMLLMYCGQSINLISMIGLIIVSGILVDDSIVVTENAVSNIEKGMDPKVAAIKGTYRIIAPVLASVMTTTAAFLPMAFMSGIFGKFVQQVPVAVITALFVSLFETFFILPGHIAHWIKPQSVMASKNTKPGLIARSLDYTRTFWDKGVVPWYARILTTTVRFRYAVMVALAGFLILTGLMASKLMHFVLFPPEGVEIFFVRTTAPLGTSLERHAELLKPIETIISALPKEELDNFVTTVGIQQQDPNDPTTKRGNEYGQIVIYLTPEPNRHRKAFEIIEDLRNKVGERKEFDNLTFNRVNPGPPQGKPVSLGVQGRNYEDILPAVKELKQLLASYPGVSDIADSYTLGKEEIQVVVNDTEAAAAGLSTAQIGTTVRAAFEGIVATKVRDLDEERDVRVTALPKSREEEGTLSAIMIPNRAGALIPLPRVASFKRDQSLSIYEHEAYNRQIHVTADLDTNKTSSTEVNNKIRKEFSKLKNKYPNVNILFGGEDEDTRESLSSLLRSFALAIIGIFLILVMTFRNLLQPVVVLLTVPLGVISVIWTFFLHGMPITFMGCLGIIALAGVIVNNAVIFVDFVNEARREGMEKKKSIVEAARTRLRPIFLTTVTTVIGILPTAYGIGGLDKFVVPIALALGWGLMIGSILTAFVFPAALSILDDFESFSGKLFRRVTNNLKNGNGKNGADYQVENEPSRHSNGPNQRLASRD